MELLVVLVGVGAFLLGQFVLRLILEPLVDARRTLATARTTHDFYADLHANPPPKRDYPATERELEASREMRRTAGILRAAYAGVLGYRLFRRVVGLPSKEALEKAAGGFVGHSNNLFGGSSQALESSWRYSDTIKKALGWNDH